MSKLRRGFKAEAERISLSICYKLGIPPTDPLDPEEVCRAFDIHLVKMSDVRCDVSAFQGAANDQFSAMTICAGFDRAIVHNDTHHIYRQRSNIFHELAHCFLGHSGCTILNDNGTRSYNSPIETEASHLGGALLLPRDAALHILKTGIKSRAQIIYGVSKPMLEYRLRVSGAQTIFERSLAKMGRAANY
jgi:Zn-dependent peptidase ImmA (M78 family)